ncbi:hypothetical protein OS493_038213 [Desmophyllum pertusum]|uniref:ZP domain-containing protein n=1 Tax=Desmophyllum pertusum TaxID=174260 RepID=A0A9W9Z6G2_9CNID|nr:hypothetical protein OS493_038213 [Desmophyllum pertusum]
MRRPVFVPSTKGGVFRFTLEGFKFIAEHPFVFVHCHIRVCDARNPKSRCAEGCIKGTRKRRDVSSDDKLYPLAQGPLTIDTDVNELNEKSTLRGMTLPAVLSMAVVSALCIVGMIWLSRKKTNQASVYAPLSMAAED